MKETYLSDQDIAKRYGVTRQAIWRWHREGDFPRVVRLSAGCSRWRLSEVEAWEARKAAASQGAAA